MPESPLRLGLKLRSIHGAYCQIRGLCGHIKPNNLWGEIMHAEFIFDPLCESLEKMFLRLKTEKTRTVSSSCTTSSFFFHGSPLVIRSTTCTKCCDRSEPLTFKGYCKNCLWICFHYLPESTYLLSLSFLDYRILFAITEWRASTAQQHTSNDHLSLQMLLKPTKKNSSNTPTLTPNNKEIRSGWSPGVRLGQIEDQMSISPVELCKHHISTTFHHQLIHLMDPTI